MPTRIYCTSGTPAVTPADWEFAAQAATTLVVGTTTKNTGFAMTSASGSTSNAGTPVLRALGRVIFGPLGGQALSGTLSGQMRCVESNAGANATLAVAVKLVTPAGADRAVLLAPVASDATTTPPEMPVTAAGLTNRPYQDAAESTSLTLTSQTATAGDYLVIEWGFRCNTGTSRTITTSYGNDSATDLTAGNTDETQAFNPWWEFSGTLALLDLLHEPAVANTTLLTESVTVRLGLTMAPQNGLALTSGTVAVATQAPGRNLAASLTRVTQAVIPASAHAIASPHILVSLYDAQTPRQRVTPGSVTVHPTTYAVTVASLQAMTGVLVLSGAPPPDAATAPYAVDVTLTTPPYTATILGSTHGFQTANLHVQVWDASTPRAVIEPGGVTVHPTTYDVVVTFLQPTSARIVISAYANTGPTALQGIAFAATTEPYTVTITAAEHGIASADLLVQVYDGSTPRQRLTPGSMTLHPTTHALTLTFLQATSGTVVISGQGVSAGPSVANTVRLTEAVALTRTPLHPVPTQALALTELVTARLLLSRSVANTSLLTTTVSLALTPLRPAPAQALALTETVVTRLGLQAAGANTVQLTEVLALQRTPLLAAVTQTVALPETVTVHGLESLAVANTGLLTTTISLALTPLRPAPVQAVALSELVGVRLLAAPSIQQLLALTEQVTLRLGLTLPLVSNTGQLTDSVTVSTTARWLVSVTDVAALTDAVTVRAAAAVAATNTLQLVDAPTVAPTLVPAPTEVLALTEAPSVVITPLHLTVLHAIQVSDSVTILRATEGLWQVQVAATLSLTDVLALVQTPLRPSATETVGLLESVTLTSTTSLSRSTMLQLTEVVSLRLGDMALAAVNTVALTESVTVMRQAVATRTVSVTDTAAVTESVITAGVEQLLTTDGLRLTDMPVLSLPLLHLETVSAVQLTETVTVVRATEGLWQMSVSSTLALTETVALHQPFLATAAQETAALTEGRTLSATLARSVATTVALTDVPVLRLPLLVLQVSQALTLSEGVTLRLPLLRLETVSALTLSETVQVLRAVEGLWQVQVSTTLALTEALSLHQPVLTLTVQDTARLTEVQTLSGTLARSVAQTLTMTEVTVLRVPLLRASPTTALTLHETVQVMLPLLRVSATESVVLTDTPTILRAIEGVWSMVVSSPLLLSEAAVLTGTLARLSSTTALLSEAVTLRSTHGTLVQATCSLTETVAVQLTTACAPSETLALSEAPTVLVPWLVPLATDTAALIPVVTLVLPLLHVTTLDATDLTDSATLYKVAEGTYILALEEGVALTEALTLTSATAIGMADAVTLTEEVQVSLGLTLLTTDTLVATEAAAGGLQITISLETLLSVTALPLLHVQRMPRRISLTQAALHSGRLQEATVHRGTMTEAAVHASTMTDATLV